MLSLTQAFYLNKPSFDDPMAHKKQIINPGEKNIDSSSSDSPIGKPLSDRNSVTTKKCLPEDVEKQVNTNEEPHAESEEFRKTTSECMVFEPDLSVADEIVMIGFDAESEDIVKNIVTKMEAEKSIDIPLPDGWVIQSMETGSCSVSWFIVDNNGMPRIECCDLKCTLKYALARKPERAMAFNILSFECSVLLKEDLTSYNEDAARDELEELLGCRVFENVYEVLKILMMPNFYQDHGEKLTCFIQPFIDWTNEEGNTQKLFQFLDGKHKNTDFAAKINAVGEVFIEKEGLPLIISICEKTTVCKKAKTNANSKEYVFLRWKYLHSVNASEDKITSECKNSNNFNDHSC